MREVNKVSANYTEANYENSVIELFRNDLEYEYVYGPDMKEIFTIHYMRMFCSILCIV